MNALKTALRRLMIAYAALCLLAVLVFYFGSTGSDAMGFGLIFFYLLLPGAALAMSAVLTAKGLRARHWSAIAAAFGAMMALTDWLTYRLSNMLAFGVWRWPDVQALMFGVVASLLGSAAGCGVRALRGENKKNKK